MAISPVTLYRDKNGRWQIAALVVINGRLEALTTEPLPK